MCILILNAVHKLSKSSLVDKWTSGIFAVVFILSMFFNISATILVLAAGLAGYIIKRFVAKEEFEK